MLPIVVFDNDADDVAAVVSLLEGIAGFAFGVGAFLAIQFALQVDLLHQGLADVPAIHAATCMGYVDEVLQGYALLEVAGCIGIADYGSNAPYGKYQNEDQYDTLNPATVLFLK
jgi:hypothetical protein